MTTVTLTDLTFARDAGFELGPIDLEFASGSRTALIGPSGCGKTTLLRLLAGFERPAGGRIALGGRVVSDATTVVSPAERRIGFVFQDGSLWPHLTARGHVQFANPELTKSAADELLALVGLDGRAASRPDALSGGEGQRLALARALACRPDVLLLDEPLASVDVHLRDELSLLIRGLATERGITLVLVTHDRDEALAVAEHVVVLRGGQVVESGAADELVQRPATAFGAAFLAGGVRVPIEQTADGVRSPFGSWPLPSEGEFELVVLPGDVAPCPAEADGAVVGEVLRARADGWGGYRLVVAIAGRPIPVASPHPVRVGDEVSVRLVGAPRLLSDRPARILETS